jgi:hypothetical protein
MKMSQASARLSGAARRFLVLEDIMPKPPLLPILDWASIFESGRSFAAWLENGGSAENRRQMLEGVDRIPLEPQEEAWLRALNRPVHVVAIAEDWCGDVVRHVPVLEHLAGAGGDRLRVRYISREQHPDVFVRFLTNGGEAIPQFVFLSDRFVECGHWGPMPAACRGIIARGKACGDLPSARKRVSALYAADPERREVVRELLDLIGVAATATP